MQKPTELYVIAEPEPVKRKVLHLSDHIREAAPATPRPVSRPWPRQRLWRERLRQLKKSPD